MKNIILITIGILILLSGVVLSVDFTDVSTTHWAYENIMNLVEKGVIKGYPDGTYKPDGFVTKGEWIKLIIRANLYEDLMQKPDEQLPHWASKYREVAERAGLLTENMGDVHLNEPITRLEMAIILAKTHIYFKKNNDVSLDKIEFKDIEELTEEQQIYIRYVSNIGLIRGYTDSTFRPNVYMNRAEVATVLLRYNMK